MTIARVMDAPVAMVVDGLVGDHRRIDGGEMVVHFHRFMTRLRRYTVDVVPRFTALQKTKALVLQSNRDEMRLDEFKPQVLTSFVRNRLIDEVYLPMIGDNLAQADGHRGRRQTHTDRMGLLLLISPPGYGKTTLMEYVANRLGVVFMKINGARDRARRDVARSR